MREQVLQLTQRDKLPAYSTVLFVYVTCRCCSTSEIVLSLIHTEKETVRGTCLWMNSKHLLHSCMSVGHMAERVWIWSHLGIQGRSASYSPSSPRTTASTQEKDDTMSSRQVHTEQGQRKLYSGTDLFVWLAHAKPRSCVLTVDPKHKEKT
jgi:hypothetical protein